MNPQHYDSELPRRKPSAFIFLKNSKSFNESTQVGLDVIERGCDRGAVEGVDTSACGISAVEHAVSTREAEEYRASVAPVSGCLECADVACYPHALAHAVLALKSSVS